MTLSDDEKLFSLLVGKDKNTAGPAAKFVIGCHKERQTEDK